MAAKPALTAVESPDMRPGMSLADYLARGDARFEIINGREVPVNAHLIEHDDLRIFLEDHLLLYARQHDLPYRIAGEMTFVNPDNLTRQWVTGSLMPDLAIVGKERIAAFRATHPDWRNLPMGVIPDLVVEVLSANDLVSDALEKISLMIKLGVPTVWLVNPRAEEVTVYHGQRSPTTLKSADLLTTDLLPGWALAVAELFSAAFAP